MEGAQAGFPKLCLTGHLAPVACAAVSAEWGLVFSASGALLLLHRTSDGRRLARLDLARALDLPQGQCSLLESAHTDVSPAARVLALVVARELGFVVGLVTSAQTAGVWLFSANLRAELFRSARLEPAGEPLAGAGALTATRDGEYLVLASSAELRILRSESPAQAPPPLTRPQPSTCPPCT